MKAFSLPMGPHLSRFWTHSTWGIQHSRLQWVHASQTVWTHNAGERFIFAIANPPSSLSTYISASLWILHLVISSSSTFTPMLIGCKLLENIGYFKITVQNFSRSINFWTVTLENACTFRLEAPISLQTGNASQPVNQPSINQSTLRLNQNDMSFHRSFGFRSPSHHWR